VGNVSTVPVSLHIPLVLAACSRGLPANRQLHSTIPRETQTDTFLPVDFPKSGHSKLARPPRHFGKSQTFRHKEI
jgi:hypothetical protein